MAKITVNIKGEDDLHVLKYSFSKTDIKGLVKTKNDFVRGATTARNWKDVEEDLNNVYNRLV